MENRYLCRGKRIDNGEWAEGYLIVDEKDYSKYFIGYVLGTNEDGTPHDLDAAQVNPSTICQCILREIEHWKDINQNGCNDPFWSDGCNMNLTRNHIIYYQSKIREVCTENQLPLPEEYYLSLPPEVDNNYMANLKQKPRVERLRQLGRIMTGRIYQYDENQMSLF